MAKYLLQVILLVSILSCKHDNNSDTYSYINYHKSKYTIDIKEKYLVQLNIDLGQRSLAGDDSWWSKPQ